MKISFNPSTVAALITPPNNKDIIFDLRGHNIFARGVKFCGTDTNTWRDIKINNVSIGSNILDLRNGSNTTLTNINGVVTINSTWRPVVDNLTSDSTTSSLSANQGRVLKALIDGKSDSDHNHDDRYLRLTGGIMASNALITFADSGSWSTDKKPRGARGGLSWSGQSDYAKVYAEETAGDNLDLVIQFGDDNSNGLSIRNASNVQTSYISAKGVITTGTFKGNLDWSYITNKPATATRWPSWDEIANKPNTFTPSNHNHDGRYVYNYGGTANVNGQALNQNALFMSTTSGITEDWWHILQAAWNDEYRWNSQIAFPTQNRNGMYYRSGLDNNTAWGSWVKLLDTNNYSSILDSRYYTESEVNNLLTNYYPITGGNMSGDNRWIGSTMGGGNDYWRIGGKGSDDEGTCIITIGDNYNDKFAVEIADYKGSIYRPLEVIYTGINTLNIYTNGTYRQLYSNSANGSTIHSILNNSSSPYGLLTRIYNDGCVSLQSQRESSNSEVFSLSLNPLGGNIGIGTTSPQMKLTVNGDISLFNVGSVRNLAIGGGIYWNSYVESTTDGSDSASITLVKSGVAGGTTLVLSQMNDANDTIQFKTSTAARLYHNSYPILTTQNTYVSGNKGYINGTEITQVNNADTVDGEHASNFVRAGVYEQGDLNSLDTYSFIRSVNSAISNTSPNGNTGWYNVIQAVHRNGASDGPNYIGQIALGMTTNINGMFYRTKYNGSWYAWNEVVTTNTGLLRYSRNNVNISSPNCSPIPPSLLEWTIGYPRLYDPEFNEGYNNVVVYNIAENGVVTVTRVHGTNVGNSSSYIIKVVSAAGAVPNYGGWHVATQTELGKVYTCLFRASIPSGVEIEWNSNSIGTGGQMSWLTNNVGTGKWTWYAVQVYCGSGGSTTFHYSAKSPCTWYLSYVNVIENNRASYAGLKSVYSDYLKANASIVFGRNELQYFNQNTSVTAGATNNANPKTNWYHILRMNHANKSGYFVDLAIPFFDNRIQLRRITNGSDNGWRRVITEEPSHNVLLCDSSDGGSVGIGTTAPSYKLDVNGQMRASGFIHSDYSINDAVLLAGGGYERIFMMGTTRYGKDTSYNLAFHKLSNLCNNLVWVDGYILESTSTSFQVSSDFYPYYYADSPSMCTIYRMDGDNMITVYGNGLVVISCSSYPRRVGFFYTGRA